MGFFPCADLEKTDVFSRPYRGDAPMEISE